MKLKPIINNVKILLVGHSWVRLYADFKDIAAENGFVFESNWWHNADLKTIIQNIERFNLIKHYHRNLLVFCLIPETWRYETLENVEPIYDNAGVPINPYEVLMPNPDFDVPIFIEKFTSFREHCLINFPKLNVVLITPPRLDVYHFNLNLICNFPSKYQEIFHTNPKYSPKQMSEYSRSVYAKILEICEYKHGWPEKSIFRNQFSAQKVKWCRKTFTKYMRQEIDTCGEAGPLVDGLNPTKDLIEMFWKQMDGWLILDQELCDNPLATYFPPKDPNSSNKPKQNTDHQSKPEQASSSNFVANSDNKNLNFEPIQSIQIVTIFKLAEAVQTVQLKVLLLGDSWVKYVGEKQNIATENGFQLDLQFWKDSNFDIIRQNVDKYLKPYHKLLMFSCITSEAWKYETLEDFAGNVTSSASQQEDNSYVSAGFQPNSNKVLMPNLNFSISDFVNKFNEFRKYCSQINSETHVMLLLPTMIDAYHFNIELISNYSESQQEIFHNNPKYAASAMAEYSLKLHEKLSLMSRKWPSSCVFRNQIPAEKVEYLKINFIRFRKGKLDTCGKESSLIDGINPTDEVIKVFWELLKCWYGASQEMSVVREPLPDGQGFKVLMIGDDSVKYLNIGMQSSISQLTVNYLSYGNVEQLIKLANTYLTLDVDVLFLAPFNWEFLYLANYVPYEDEPKVPLINEFIEMEKLIEVVKNSTEIWKQSFPGCKVIWALPHPVDFQKHYEWKVTEYGMNWNPTPEMNYEILYMTKAFYSLILQLEKEWKQSIPEIHYIDLRQCFFAEEPNLEYTFCDNNQPVFPSNGLSINGIDPSETLGQWLKMALVDKIEEMEKAAQIELLREKRRKQRRVQNYNRYLKKKKEKEANIGQEETANQNAGKASDAAESTNTACVSKTSAGKEGGTTIKDCNGNLKVDSDAATNANVLDPIEQIKLKKKEKRQRKKIRQKEKLKLSCDAETPSATNETEPTIQSKPEVYLIYPDGESHIMEEDSKLPKLMDLPLAPPGYMTSLSVEQDLLVTSSMLDTLGETLPYLKKKPMEISPIVNDQDVIKTELSMLTKLVEEEFADVSPFRILDINDSSYSYKFGLFFQRSKWEDLFLIGSKEVAMDAILSAIKSMLMLKCEKGVKVVMITTSMSFISEIEGYLKPLIDKNFIGVNDDVPLGCPIALINTPANLSQRFSQPKLWDLSDVSAIIIYGDDLIFDMRSPTTNELSTLIKLIYSNVHYELVNRVVISETGAKEYERVACQILRTRFTAKIDMKCPPPKDESLSLFELLAAEFEKNKREQAEKEFRKLKSKKTKLIKKNKISNQQAPNKLSHTANKGGEAIYRNPPAEEHENIRYPLSSSTNMLNDYGNAFDSVPDNQGIYPFDSKLDSSNLSNAANAEFELFLKNLGPSVENEYEQAKQKTLISHDKLCQNYIDTPNYHLQYQTERSIFIEGYKLKFGENYNQLEMENALTDYWKKYVADFKVHELKRKIHNLQDEYKSKYSTSDSVSVNSATIGAAYPLANVAAVKDINISSDTILTKKNNSENINDGNVVNSLKERVNRFKSNYHIDETNKDSGKLKSLQKSVNETFGRIFSSQKLTAQTSQEVVSEMDANHKPSIGHIDSRRSQPISSKADMFSSVKTPVSIQNLERHSGSRKSVNSFGDAIISKSEVRQINEEMTTTKPNRMMNFQSKDKVKFTLSSKEERPISQHLNITGNAYQLPKSKNKYTPHGTEKNSSQNTGKFSQRNERGYETSFSEGQIKSLLLKEYSKPNKEPITAAFSEHSSRISRRSIVPVSAPSPSRSAQNLRVPASALPSPRSDRRWNVPVSAAPSPRSDRRWNVPFSEAPSPSPNYAQRSFGTVPAKPPSKSAQRSIATASAVPPSKNALKSNVPVSDLIKSSVKKPSFGELLKMLGTSDRIEELMDVVSDQNLSVTTESAVTISDVSRVNNGKRPRSQNQTTEKLELESNPGMQEYLRESRQKAQNKNVYERLESRPNDSYNKKLKRDSQSSSVDRNNYQNQSEQKTFKINLRKNETIQTGPVAQPFQKEKDLYMLETSLNLLEPICDDLGMIGPSLKLVIAQAKSCLPNCKQAFKIFSVEESISLVNFAINKMKTLSVGPNTNKYTREIQLGSDLLQQAIIYSQQPPTSIASNSESVKAPSVYPVDVTLIAKATSGKDSVHIYEFIKNTFVYKGLLEPTAKEIEDVYKAVAQIHFNK